MMYHAYCIFLNYGHAPTSLYDSRYDCTRFSYNQRRYDGTVDFGVGWDQYAAGFGAVTGEYWLGLDHIHRLASTYVHLNVCATKWYMSGGRTHSYTSEFKLGNVTSA